MTCYYGYACMTSQYIRVTTRRRTTPSPRCIIPAADYGYYDRYDHYDHYGRCRCRRDCHYSDHCARAIVVVVVTVVAVSYIVLFILHERCYNDVLFRDCVSGVALFPRRSTGGPLAAAGRIRTRRRRRRRERSVVRSPCLGFARSTGFAFRRTASIVAADDRRRP